MGDAADILGVEQPKTGLTAEASKILTEKFKPLTNKVKKPKGMSREVYCLLGRDSITSSLQPALPVSSVFKSKRQSRNHWVWSTVFPDVNLNTNMDDVSTRNDPVLHHWYKADMQGHEYPYLKFDVKIERLTFTDDEYESYLKSDKWTQSESEYLMDLCYNFDLRWPVIYDRYNVQPQRRPEEIQERFYTMTSVIQAIRSGVKDFNSNSIKLPFVNIEVERNRKIQQELQFHKTKQEAQEETVIQEELKTVEVVLKKSRKSTKAADKTASKVDTSAMTSAAFIPAINGNPDSMDLSYTAPGKPALQSSRLLPAEFTTNLSKNLLRKLSVLLKELGLQEKMLPTKTICDLYDQVRRDGVALLSLHNIIAKKEKEIAVLRLKNLNASTATIDVDVKSETVGSSSSSAMQMKTLSTIKVEESTFGSTANSVISPPTSNPKKGQKRKKVEPKDNEDSGVADNVLTTVPISKSQISTDIKNITKKSKAVSKNSQNNSDIQYPPALISPNQTLQESYIDTSFTSSASSSSSSQHH